MNMAQEREISYLEWQRSPNQPFVYRSNFSTPDDNCGIAPMSDSQATGQRLSTVIREIILIGNCCLYSHLEFSYQNILAQRRAILSMSRSTSECVSEQLIDVSK